MKSSIEVKSIKMDESGMYEASNYPGEGIYTLNDTVHFVVGTMVLYLCTTKELAGLLMKEEKVDLPVEDVPEVPEKKSAGLVSEEFSLKMLAIATGQKLTGL